MTTLVLYHANCVDGFIAQHLFNYVFDDVYSVPCRYNVELDMVDIYNKTGKIDKIYIVDYNLDLTSLSLLTNYCKDITVIDHHETSAEMYRGYKSNGGVVLNGCKINTIINTDLCASKLVFEIFKNTIKQKLIDKFDKDEGPYQNNQLVLGNNKSYYHSLLSILNFVDDYDRWNLEFEHTFIVNQIIREIFESKSDYKTKTKELDNFIVSHSELEEYYKDFDKLIAETIDAIYSNQIKNAVNIINDRNAIVKHYIENIKFIQIQNYNVPFIQCPGTIANYVGHALSDEHPFVFTYWVNVNSSTVKISLRSNKQKGVDVEKIAKKYGGGGHKSAAGILLSLNDFTKQFND